MTRVSPFSRRDTTTYHGRVPEWPKGAACKAAVHEFKSRHGFKSLTEA